MRQAGIIVALFVSITLSLGQSDEKLKKFSPNELRQDMAALRRALAKYHPGMYWYTSKEEFDSTWNSLYQGLDQPLNEMQFFKLLLPVVAKVKCAHTLLYPSHPIISSGLRFPLDIKLIGEKVYLWPDSLNTYNVPQGSELMSINNRPVQVVLKQLLPNLQAQGGNRGWKKVILENDFQNYYHYIIEQADQFLIKYVNHDTGLEESRIVTGSNEELLRMHWKNWYPAKDGTPLKIEYLQDQEVAILTIKSLVRGRAKAYGQDFDKLIEQFFVEIRNKGIRKLIIDVRGNEGGNKPEKLYSYVAKQNSRNPDARRNDKNAYITPARANFAGQVIVLANERSISAQETFVSVFKNNKRGFIVGRATPGCYRGLCGGKKHKLVMPNSRFEIRIPMNASPRIFDYQTNYKEGEGFTPDFRVEEDVNDILEGKDAIKSYALKLIQN